MGRENVRARHQWQNKTKKNDVDKHHQGRTAQQQTAEKKPRDQCHNKAKKEDKYKCNGCLLFRYRGCLSWHVYIGVAVGKLQRHPKMVTAKMHSLIHTDNRRPLVLRNSALPQLQMYTNVHAKWTELSTREYRFAIASGSSFDPQLCILIQSAREGACTAFSLSLCVHLHIRWHLWQSHRGLHSSC